MEFLIDQLTTLAVFAVFFAPLGVVWVLARRHNPFEGWSS